MKNVLVAISASQVIWGLPSPLRGYDALGFGGGQGEGGEVGVTKYCVNKEMKIIVEFMIAQCVIHHIKNQ